MFSYTSAMASSTELLSRDEREERLESAGYNVFNLASEDVFVDLLTDSGTGTMSDTQWAAMMEADEAYAGSESFLALETAIAEVMGFDRVVPTHQGRGAENVLYGCLIEVGDVVPNNTHFDTTRAHVAENGGDPVDCPVEGAGDLDSEDPFKGNLDTECVRELADDVGPESIPAVILTITNNSVAGQPVSMANIEETRDLADELDATFVIDACRFAENALFIREREDGYAERSSAEIAREQLSHADTIVMSGKKDGLVNVGGFVGVRDPDLFERAKQRAILYEGFSTYGGMAGRDMAAMAVGLREAVSEEYLTARIGQVRALGERLRERNVPIYTPVGGHAVYIDAGRALPHVPDEEFPGQALVCELYREGGVRGVELGGFAFPNTDRPNLVRLALPRRTYHDEHLDHVAETASAVLERGEEVRGLEVVSEPENEALRHFSARLKPV
ncbi:tryptophanase [Halalkalicoccus jeotgali]|uniref:Tryptophanase n=1 Tax=Halalkalicoccus jeotgali (strain DSM 18796 / CECT 7217 / JCM 14584 / KCTC 4019 / B3) TaxID=795797 RepID=D8J365_HALJB|nr:tryptophanase [Halalkalicoccus jeotgali]ADJ15172.1 tryptophanase [Halalkalicoccus jeotgali B3]ELY35108.1 tryptophanase/L-cysteine desulfhydrase, PLP-dependent [Halalkalicoccus jeotgali B3]